MRALSVEAMLRLPVRLHGIQLARPVDVLLDAAGARLVGFEVVCGDGSERFLPFAAASVGEEEITVRSPLMLLEEVDFYRARAASFRELGGTTTAAGALQDVLVAPDGTVDQLVVDGGGGVLGRAPARLLVRRAA